MTQIFFQCGGDFLMMNTVVHSQDNPTDPSSALTNRIDGYYITFTSNTSNANKVTTNKILSLDTWHTVQIVVKNCCVSGKMVGECYIDGDFVCAIPAKSFFSSAANYNPTGAIKFRVSTTMRFSGINYFDNLTYSEAPVSAVLTTYSPYSINELTNVKSFIDGVLDLTVDGSSVTINNSGCYAPLYKATLQNNVLTVYRTDGVYLDADTVKTIVINGTAYTRGWTVDHGILTAPYAH